MSRELYDLACAYHNAFYEFGSVNMGENEKNELKSKFEEIIIRRANALGLKLKFHYEGKNKVFVYIVEGNEEKNISYFFTINELF